MSCRVSRRKRKEVEVESEVVIGGDGKRVRGVGTCKRRQAAKVLYSADESRSANRRALRLTGGSYHRDVMGLGQSVVGDARPSGLLNFSS